MVQCFETKVIRNTLQKLIAAVINLFNYNFGVCTPAACLQSDVIDSFNFLLQFIKIPNLNVTLFTEKVGKEGHTLKNQENDYSGGSIAYM